MFCMGLVWTVASVLGFYNYTNTSILILLAGSTLFKPFYKTVRRLAGYKSTEARHPLNLLVSLMSIGVPLGVVAGFFPFMENINLFFPSFAILFGIIFGTIGYVFNLRIYLALGLIKITGAVYIGMNYIQQYSAAGFYCALVLLIFSLIGKIYGEFDIRYLNLRRKVRLPE